MPIGIGEDHEELRRTVRRWVETRCPPEVPRALLDAGTESLPAFWDELAGQGWLGIHVPEEYGGQGFGLMELAVVVEELARAAAPGPVLTTMLAAAVLAGSSDPADAKELLPRIVDGSMPAVVSLPGSGSSVGRHRSRRIGDPEWDRPPRPGRRRRGPPASRAGPRRRCARGRRSGAPSSSTPPGSAWSRWPAWIRPGGWRPST